MVYISTKVVCLYQNLEDLKEEKGFASMTILGKLKIAYQKYCTPVLNSHIEKFANVSISRPG